MTTKRENLLRTLRRQGFEEVPIDLVLCEAQVAAFRARFGTDDYASFFGLSHRTLPSPVRPTYSDPRALYRRETLPAGTTFDEYGVGHSKGSALALHMTRMHHPLAGEVSLEEVATYPLPEVDAARLPGLEAAVARLHAEGLAAFAFMQMTVWEASWYLRSMESLLFDMMTGDERAEVLLDRVTAYACALAEAYAAAGADILSLGDDIGTQTGPLMSIALWARWLKPRLGRVIAAARARKPDIIVFYHSCGHVTPFLDGLIEVGVDVLNPVQPECMDFEEVHARFGDRLSFWGAIGTQQLLPFGTPAAIRATVRARIETCGPKGGLVIAPAHWVEPEVPWENLLAMVEAARDAPGARTHQQL